MDPLATLRRVLWVALAYAVVGALTVRFSLHFGVPSSIFPAAGIAVGAVCFWGAPMALGILLGRVLLSMLSAGTFGPSTYSLGVEGLIALAVTLQALAGGLVARRAVGPAERLDTGAGVLRLLALVGPASCWIAPALGVQILTAAQRVSSADAAYTFYKWWAGDSLGAVLVVPLFYPLFAKPRDAWRKKGRVLLPALLGSLLLLSFALFLVSRWEKRRQIESFQAEGRRYSDAVNNAVRALPLLARSLQSGLESASVDPASQKALALFSTVQALAPGGAKAGWLPLDEPEPASGLVGIAARVRAAPEEAVVALALSDGGDDTAQTGPRLVVATRADPGARTGAAFLALPADRLLAAGGASAKPLGACLVDTRSGTRLAGAAGCERAHLGLLHQVPLAFGDGGLALRLTARPDYAAIDRAMGIWAVEVVVLFGSAFFVAFLLMVTGRTQRVEQLVAERTDELQRSENRLRSVLDTAIVGIQYLGLDGHIERMNPEGERITGYSSDEIRHLHVTSLAHPDDAAEGARMLSMLLSGQIDRYTREYRLVRKDGSLMPVLVRVSLVRGEDGRPLHAVSVLEDLTEAKRMQGIERAREAAEAANRSKGEFLSRMSHELRTPLNAILGFAQVMRLSEPRQLGSAQSAQLAHIERAGWHLLSMIDEILDLSRIEAGQLRLDVKPLDAVAMARSASAMLASAADARGTLVHIRAAQPLIRVLADATRLQQVIVNLLSNAIKYGRAGGNVDVDLHPQGGVLALSVSDDGAGLSPQQLDSLYVPFNRLGQERTRTEGTGIGLVIARQLVERMGGRIEARSTLGVGSTFTVWLPLAPQDADVHGSTRPAGLDGGSIATARILCIEDNEVNAVLLRAIFEHDPEVRLEMCDTAMQGLQRAQANPPDVILLDLNLPDMPGMDLIRALRAAPGLQHTRLIVVTADATAESRERAMQAGAHGYLTKPLDVAALRAEVERSLAA